MDLDDLRLTTAHALVAEALGERLPSADGPSTPYLQALIDGLCELSLKDPLTGLHNRRYFDAVIESEIDRVARTGEAALLLMIDIDHFKQVNDIHGHNEGDRVLVELAGVLRAQFAGCGMAARYGGEEFVILMPRTPLAQAELQCQYLRQAIAHLPLGLPLTVSIGLASQQPGESAQDMLRRADAALYQAKAQGRDRVVVAE